jgi:hypothetical protein
VFTFLNYLIRDDSDCRRLQEAGFRIVLGRGGMGEVYLAQDKLGRKVPQINSVGNPNEHLVFPAGD